MANKRSISQLADLVSAHGSAGSSPAVAAHKT